MNKRAGDYLLCLTCRLELNGMELKAGKLGQLSSENTLRCHHGQVYVSSFRQSRLANGFGTFGSQLNS